MSRYMLDIDEVDRRIARNPHIECYEDIRRALEIPEATWHTKKKHGYRLAEVVAIHFILAVPGALKIIEELKETENEL